MGKIKNITEADIELSKVYFTLLVEVAIRKETISYGDLVELSKKRYKSKTVQDALTRTIGRRLEVLRIHTDAFKLPDVSSLCFNVSSSKTGDAYHLDPEKERKKVYRTHWLNHYCDVMHLLDTTLNEGTKL